MDNTLYFNASTVIDGKEIDSLCIFFNSNFAKHNLDFYNDLEIALKSCRTLPDCISIFADASNIANFNCNWKNKEKRELFLDRCIRNGVKFTKHLFFVEWSNILTV